MKQVSNILRDAMVQAERRGVSLYRIAKECELDDSIVYRFYHDDCGLALTSVDKLCLFLGLRLTPMSAAEKRDVYEKVFAPKAEARKRASKKKRKKRAAKKKATKKTAKKKRPTKKKAAKTTKKRASKKKAKTAAKKKPAAKKKARKKRRR